jgi:hypothetical protein
MIKDSFDSKDGIVTASLTGKLTIEEALEWINSITPDRFPVRKLRILMDASDVEYAFQPKQVRLIISTIRDKCSGFDLVKNAAIHNTPREAAFSFLLSNHPIHNNYTHQAFSTKEAAMEWLLET